MSLVSSLVRGAMRRRIRTGLDGIRIRGLDALRSRVAAGPVVCAATHVSWWDGPVLVAVDEALGRVSRVWMDADRLRRLSFLASVGAVPVHANAPARLRGDFDLAARYLTGPGRVWWVFPQGGHRPSSCRPLVLHDGAAVLARRAGAVLLPVALTYVFDEVHVPTAWVDIGAPVDGPRLEAALIQGLERIDRAATGEGPAFDVLVPSRVRPSHDRWPSRVLASVLRHA